MQHNAGKKSKKGPHTLAFFLATSLGEKKKRKKTLTPPHSEFQKPMPLMGPFVHEKGVLEIHCPATQAEKPKCAFQGSPENKESLENVSIL